MAVIQQVSPVIGSPLGGDLLILRGTGLSGVIAISVGGVAATAVRVLSDVEVTAVSPPGKGPADIVVEDPSGATVVSGRFSYGPLTVDVLRADDLLVLRVEFANAELVSGEPPTVVSDQAGVPLRVVFTFPPQHVAESVADPARPAASMLSGPSRLAFDVAGALPLSVESLLDWAGWVAVIAGATGSAPSDTQTALEVPYRLVVTPPPDAGWRHASTAIDASGSGTVEVWHTDLRLDSPGVLGIPWCVDIDSGVGVNPTVAPPLGMLDRFALTQFGSGEVSRLSLTALGAWAEFDADLGAFVSQSGLTAWRHIVGQGRDQYVRVVHRGYLAPFGHRASLAGVSERRLFAAADGTVEEGLVETSYLAPSSREVDYSDAGSRAILNDGRALPFTHVRLLTTSLPPLDQGAHALSDGAVGIPFVGGTPALFHLIATDHAGQDHELVMPLLWVPESLAASADSGYTDGNAVAATLGGGAVSYVPADLTQGDPVAGDVASVLPTFGMAFDVRAQGQPFLPVMRAAQVSVPAVDQLLGSSGGGGNVVFGFHPGYLASGANAGAVFGQFLTSLTDPTRLGLDVNVPADKAGGVGAPHLPLDGLSAVHGAVVAADSVLDGAVFDPSTLHLGTVLGVIDLDTLLAAIAPSTPEQMPRMLQQRTATDVTTSFTWAPPMKVGAAGLIMVSQDSRLTLSCRTVTSLADPANSTFTVDGRLTAFTLTFLDAIMVTFDSLAFHSENGRKVDVTTGKDLQITFAGDLSFINELAQLLPPSGFEDPPFVHASPEGVSIGYTLGIPSAGVGVLSFENIAISAGLDLAFNGPAAMRLAFSERHHPFLVTVSLIAGGGFLAVEADTTGIRRVEAAFELGANLSLDFVIVSANVHVLAGFYFDLDNGAVRFQGYLRVGGSVDLLGIVTISVELVLSLEYSTDGKAIEGTASVTVAVTVLAMSKSFTLTVHRSFAVPGTGMAPRLAAATTSRLGFGQLMTPQDWSAYAAAFG